MDYNLFNPKKYDKESKELKGYLNHENKFTYLFYGRPGISKGFEYLFRAVPKISRKIPNSRLICHPWKET
jgi:glycosyltransferase involved in cell wall biosynthesis